MKQRAIQLQEKLLPHQAFLISSPLDVQYFTQFQFLVPEEREAFFVVTKTGFYLIRASFSPLPTTEEIFFTVLENCKPAALAKHLKKIVEMSGVETTSAPQLTEILFDHSSLFVEELEAIKSELKTIGGENNDAGSSVVLSPFDRNLIWQQRMIKDKKEVEVMARAGQIIAEVMQKAIRAARAGMTEQDLAHFIDQELHSLGAEKPAFPTIVAFGANGAEPHYQPSATIQLQPNTPILIDAGAIFHNYRSDMTRTFWFGDQPSSQFLAIEKIVKDAYEAAFSFVQNRAPSPTSPPRLTARDIDSAARKIINAAGYGDQFIHTTGHGIGLDIHEPPSLNWSNEMPIENGMTITIEPGIYLVGQFGYRHENTILVQSTGATVLTTTEPAATHS